MNIKHDKVNVLKTGMALLCSKGYSNLGVDEICKVTGMTKGAFYNAFKSKEQFLIEAVLLYGENNVKRIKSELEPNGQNSAFERLQMFYHKMLKAQPRNNFTGCFINNIMSEMGFVSELVGIESSKEFVKFIDAIVPTVMEAQENGEMNRELDARQITELLHSTFYGVLTIAKSSQNIDQSILTINLLFNNLKPNQNA
ncbi:TetR/AcrR family transcriptional regulator [Lacihabitans sp. LS3-19]|uniref:TetR/AcrR family transcriptional regulator n=1 Tax=Lacihabitans sp. LS3-19 TaxID=2487335 RepID=UPI0020CDF910|nr:TetR/AcrR family transcriptional regulator [Lacihabitans sp. LS3-19]MCP9768981.1 TetR/AcrR family transcriptional regulator [Lacihabitans sp. LS3-19]